MTEIDKVRVLGDREQAREKLPIFFGSRDNYIHPLKELIANGTDELNSKFKNGTIKVKHTITENNESLIEVEDSGRGLPIGEFDDEGTSYLDMLLLTMFGGGKYDNNDGMTGLNGVGLTVTNYTSKYFKVESAYNGQLHTVVFTDGGQNQKYTTKKIAKTKHFTRVSYILDNKVYTSNKLKDNDINDWVKKVSAVAPKIDFTFTDSTGEEFKYHYKDLKTYFEDIVGGLSTSAIFLNEKDGVFEFDNKENNKYEVLFTTQATPVHQVFLNGTPFSEDSSIDSGVINGIRLWFEKQYEGKRKVKPFTNQDIIDSVSYVVNVVSSNAEFSNQTKLSTKKKLYQSQTKQSVQDILDSFKDKHAVYFNRFEKHLLQVQEANHKSDNNKTKLLKKLNENIDAIKGRVEGFIDSREHGLESEFFLTEGKSALGSVVAARDSKFQAALPLRGKILNVEKAKQSEITANQEISNILKIIGGGYGNDFDIDKARFGKVIITCFTGDTKVKMLDGTKKTLKELSESNQDEYDVFSVNDFGEVIPSKGHDARKVGTAKTMYKITLDSGKTIESTPDHFFVNRDGEYVMAKDLFIGQSLMPLYIDNEYGYMKRQAVKDNLTGNYNYLHRLVYDFYNNDYRQPNNGRAVNDMQIHHKNDNKTDNRPDNLELIPTELHRSINASDSWLMNEFNGSQAQKDMLAKKREEGVYDNVTWTETYNKTELHKQHIADATKRGIYKKANSKRMTDYNKSIEHSQNTSKMNADPEHVKNIQKNRIIQSIKFLLINNMEINEKNWQPFKKIGTPQLSNIYKYFDDFEEVIKYVIANTQQIDLDGYRATFEKKRKNRQKYNDLHRDDYDYNHKITNIEVIEYDEPIDVYCMTVDKWHNFAIDADENNNSGVFVKNCDQDDDGFHIQALIISLFNTIARPMLEQGRIYIAKTPLYIIHFTDKDDVLYVSSETEMDKIRPTLKNVRTISRVKGLGELDAQTMRDTAMNPETRQITQVTFNDVKQANQMIQNWLGSENDYRKDYITEHLPEFLVE